MSFQAHSPLLVAVFALGLGCVLISVLKDKILIFLIFGVALAYGINSDGFIPNEHVREGRLALHKSRDLVIWTMGDSPPMGEVINGRYIPHQAESMEAAELGSLLTGVRLHSDDSFSEPAGIVRFFIDTSGIEKDVR